MRAAGREESGSAAQRRRSELRAGKLPSVSGAYSDRGGQPSSLLQTWTAVVGDLREGRRGLECATRLVHAESFHTTESRSSLRPPLLFRRR
jgi:hypothetical protein